MIILFCSPNFARASKTTRVHPKLRACIQNYARTSKTSRVHPKLRACIQNFARASKTTRVHSKQRVHPKLRACIQNYARASKTTHVHPNFARASKTTCVHPKLRACIQNFARASKTTIDLHPHKEYLIIIFYIYVFLIIVSPPVRSGDCSDCYVVIFFSFYHLHALQSDSDSNSFYVLGRKYVFCHPESYFTNWGLNDFESRLKTYLSP